MTLPAPVNKPRPRLRGWLHGSSVPFAAGGLWLLSQAVGDLPPVDRLPALFYGFAVLALLLTSAIYHIPTRWSAGARARLLRLDGSATVLLIVGTFTPVAAYALEGAWRRWSLLGAAAVAVVGVGLAATRVKTPPRLSATGYVVAGWLTAIPMWRVAAVLPRPGLVLIILGGVVYSAGAVVYAARRPDPIPAWAGYHEVFHALVVVAAGLHFAAIWFHVLPLATT